MAKVVSKKVDSNKIKLLKPARKIVILGLLSGLLYWALVSLLVNGNYSLSISSNIAAILIATIGIIAMVLMQVEQPVIISVATALSLWGLAQLTDGLALYEIIIWSIGLYGLAYLLFFWVTRYSKAVPVIIVTTIIVTIARLIVLL